MPCEREDVAGTVIGLGGTALARYNREDSASWRPRLTSSSAALCVLSFTRICAAFASSVMRVFCGRLSYHQTAPQPRMFWTRLRVCAWVSTPHVFPPLFFATSFCISLLVLTA